MAFNKNKKILLIVAAILFAAGIVLGLVLGLKNRKYRIAVYDLPADVSEKVVENVQNADKKFVCTVIEKGSGFSVDESKKYDAVITMDGLFAKSLAKNGVELPASVYSKMPASVRRAGLVDGKRLLLPIIYDHVPIYMCRSATTYSSTEGPSTLAALEENLQAERSAFDFTLLCAGDDDECLYGLLSMVAESILGGEGYKKLAEKIAEKNDFRQVLDEVVSNSRDGVPLSLRTVVNRIFDWQQKGLIQPQWYKIKEGDIVTLMQNKAFAFGSMPLDYYRNLPRRIGYNYSVYRFPQEDVKMDHGLVAPMVVMVSRSKKKPMQRLEEYLVSQNVQGGLSNTTTYAPVHSQAGTYDSIADDARFYAAATSMGPLPVLDMAAFNSEEKAAKFAQDVRDYLMVGN